MKNIINIAVLITCYNQKEAVLRCISSIALNSIDKNKYHLDIYLVDDGSSDGTETLVKMMYPKINIVRGNGNLYWNRAMRVAWDYAARKNDYDYYLWLNSDTYIFSYGINELLMCHSMILSSNKCNGIIVGACCDVDDNSKVTYSGYNRNGIIAPNGKIQECSQFNGNIVLIPAEIFKVIGNLSNKYTHGIGDFEYGLRARQAGYKSFITSIYVAQCNKNINKEDWNNSEIKFIERYKIFISVKGLNVKEYYIFQKEYYGIISAIKSIVKAYIKMIIPKLYKKIKKEKY